MTRKQAAFETTYDAAATLAYREVGYYPSRRTVAGWIAVGCSTPEEIAEQITRTPDENIH